MAQFWSHMGLYLLQRHSDNGILLCLPSQEVELCTSQEGMGSSWHWGDDSRKNCQNATTGPGGEIILVGNRGVDWVFLWAKVLEGGVFTASSWTGSSVPTKSIVYTVGQKLSQRECY